MSEYATLIEPEQVDRFCCCKVLADIMGISVSFLLHGKVSISVASRLSSPGFPHGGHRLGMNREVRSYGTLSAEQGRLGYG
jgi:hypothetical protein